MSWAPFRDGVRIHRLYGDGVTGPSAALLRYDPGARIPEHEHLGYEHIFVLAGSQTDAAGSLPAGSFAVHAPGTRHSVQSGDGCVVLAIYERPVRVIEDGAATEG